MPTTSSDAAPGATGTQRRCLRNERGQVFVLSAVMMMALLGMGALVLDAGSWFQEKRRLQGAADAAALAGAQALPDDPANAQTLAVNYASQNGGGVAAADVQISSTYSAADTITVDAKSNMPGIFSRVFGVGSVGITAHAAARTGVPAQAWGVAPITVNCAHPLIDNCAGGRMPTFNEPTTIPLGKAGAPGAFDLINLDGSRGGISPGILADWVQRGYQGYLDLGDYYSDPGAKFNSSQMQSALNARIGSVLLFPVYDTLTGTGANARYHVIGWIGFYITAFSARGSSGSIDGYFTTYIARGILPSGGGGPPDMGVRTIQLTQ